MSDELTGPGAIVRNQREALGLTCREVADSLNLTVRVVDDIECENWARLPAPAFTRGYLRAYAKLLEIDPDQVAGAFEAAMDRGNVRAASDVSPIRIRHGRGVADLAQRHPGAVLTGAVAGVICAALIVLWMVWPAPKDSAAAAEPAAAPMVAPPPKPTPATQLASEVGKAVVPTVNSVDEPVPAANEEAASSAPTVHDAPGVRRITRDGNDRLQFTFIEDCWVEIKDAHGDSLYSELSHAGETLNLVGHRPFHILLGNAPAVTLAYNDEQVALSPHTRNNVGTLVLGQ